MDFLRSEAIFAEILRHERREDHGVVSLQFGQQVVVVGVQGFPVLRSGDVCAEPAPQWCVGTMAVGASERRVVVPAGAVEVVVVRPEDKAFAEFPA